MKTPKIAEHAGSLAFVIFTLGASGVLLALAVAMMTSPGDAGRETLVNWITVSLVISLCGAILGSVADAAPASKPQADEDRLAHLKLPQSAAIPLRKTAAPARTSAPHAPVSAFRPALDGR